VAIRSTPFPVGKSSKVARVLAAFEAGGGLRAIVEDSDWRAMAAFAAFRDLRGSAPAFEAWRKRARPLTGLGPLRTMLDLDAE
jgi:hypothetical protein